NESEIEGQFTRQDESEEQPGSALAQEGQLARDSQQSDELATEDESTKQDDQADKLEGDVHVAGKKTFPIQNNAQLLNWEEYGLRITVPEGVVPPSETIEVSITALVGGEFILPEDSELVSVVYKITVSKPLLKPVLLEIQHCVSIETQSHANCLRFVASSNDHCPFEFQTVDGKGSFPVGERYGSILISKFSFLTIITEIIRGLFTLPLSSSSTSSNESTSTDLENESYLTQDIDTLPASWLYFAQSLYENERLGREWLLIFLFGRDLNAIKMYMKDEFNRSKSDKELSFQFESSEGFIEIHTDTENCSEGWSIRPHQENPTQVSQSIIDIYGRMNPPCFPHCRFTITATPGSTTVNPELKHPVTFRGIISNNTVFNIVLTMGKIARS
uniref:Uncharacterized protein n=1 Tax=Amphimedon queenslandica TaxID=400682 RepID=A0A1X7TA01_AMPQE